jgi:hypothetical protein
MYITVVRVNTFIDIQTGSLNRHSLKKHEQESAGPAIQFDATFINFQINANKKVSALVGAFPGASA